MLSCVAIMASLVFDDVTKRLGSEVMTVPVIYVSSGERKNISCPGFRGGIPLVLCLIFKVSFVELSFC